MKKTTLLNTAIAATFLAGSASVIAAPSHTGDLGDSRIHYPLAGATITEAATDVWFVAALDADFYTIDLRAYDPDGGGCGHMKETGEGANTTHITKMFNVHDPKLQCGDEIVGTAPVTGYYDKTDGDITSEDDEDGEADFHLCKWRTPDLPNGDYQIAINSIKLGHRSVTENRFDCKSDAAQIISGIAMQTANVAFNLPTALLPDLEGTSGINATAYMTGNPDVLGFIDLPLKAHETISNKHRDPNVYHAWGGAGATAIIPLVPPYPLTHTITLQELTGRTADMNYQKLKIAVPENQTEVTIVNHPLDPIVIYPVHETQLTGDEDDTASRVEFLDPSPANRAADWYELWVSKDSDNTRLFDIESNPSYGNWYKLIVDSSELLCTQRAGDNGRICTIEIVSPTIQAALTSDKFNWWVRGWNDEFQEEPAEGGNGWSDKGTFTGSN